MRYVVLIGGETPIIGEDLGRTELVIMIPLCTRHRQQNQEGTQNASTDMLPEDVKHGDVHKEPATKNKKL